MLEPHSTLWTMHRREHGTPCSNLDGLELMQLLNFVLYDPMFFGIPLSR